MLSRTGLEEDWKGLNDEKMRTAEDSGANLFLRVLPFSLYQLGTLRRAKRKVCIIALHERSCPLNPDLISPFSSRSTS